MNPTSKECLKIKKLLYVFILVNIVICDDFNTWLNQFKSIFNSDIISINMEYELKSESEIFQSIPKTGAEILYSPKNSKLKFETPEMIFISDVDNWKNLNKKTNQMIIDNHADSTIIKISKYFNYNYLKNLNKTKINNRKFLLTIDDFEIIVKVSKKPYKIDRIIFDMDVVKYYFYNITFSKSNQIYKNPFAMNVEQLEIFDLRE